jgi:hypothetical protein
MKYIITESQNENLKVLLKQVIKSKGTLTAIKSVNGFDNFLKIMDIDSPRDFLNLFNDLDAVDSEENSDFVLFRYKPKHNLMIYDKRTDFVYINYDEIWSVLGDNFGLNHRKKQGLTEEWLGEVYNLRGVTTFTRVTGYLTSLVEVYNLSS